MSLEEEIQQKQFRNINQKARVNLIYTANWLTNDAKSRLKEHGITLQQFNVLRILRGQHPCPISTSDIRSRMLDKMSDASRIVDRLCKQGLARRGTCAEDKRLVDVIISDKGLELLKRLDCMEQHFDDFLNLTDEEAETLSNLLDKARGA